MPSIERLPLFEQDLGEFHLHWPSPGWPPVSPRTVVLKLSCTQHPLCCWGSNSDKLNLKLGRSSQASGDSETKEVKNYLGWGELCFFFGASASSPFSFSCYLVPPPTCSFTVTITPSQEAARNPQLTFWRIDFEKHFFQWWSGDSYSL